MTSLSDVEVGTRFGLAVATPPRSEAMTATLSEAGHDRFFSARRHERRRGLEELLATLARGIDRRLDVSLMRGTLEQLLRKIVPVRTVHIRDLSGRWSPR